MTLLVLDSSLGAVQAGLFDDEGRTCLALERRVPARGEAEALPELVAGLLGEDRRLDTVSRAIVTVGPGSFTGIRIGLAAARGFALALGVPAVGLSSLACFAAPALAARFPGHVAAVIDARHGAVYFQLFGPDGRSVVPAALMPIEEAVRKIGGSQVFVTGNAAEAVAERLRRAGAGDVEFSQEEAPDAAAMARLGRLADPAIAPPEPLYLKGANADPQERARVARL